MDSFKVNSINSMFRGYHHIFSMILLLFIMTIPIMSPTIFWISSSKKMLGPLYIIFNTINLFLINLFLMN